MMGIENIYFSSLEGVFFGYKNMFEGVRKLPCRLIFCELIKYQLKCCLYTSDFLKLMSKFHKILNAKK